MSGFLSRLVDGVAHRVAALSAERQSSDARWSPATKVALRALWLQHREHAQSGRTLPAASDTGFRIFSQFDEDGIIVFLLASLGDETKLFLDIGGGDGVHASNCANVAINFGFHGLFIDGNQELVTRGARFYAEHPDTSLYPPAFAHARVSPRDINDVVRQHGLSGDIDLLSIDIDGNDYWIWEALTGVKPRIVVIETHPELGRQSLVAPYADDPTRVPGQPAHFLGASPAAMTALATRLGYRLVAANRFGFNLFYVRDDLAGRLFPAIDAGSAFDHPRARERELPASSVQGLPFIRP